MRLTKMVILLTSSLSIMLLAPNLVRSLGNRPTKDQIQQKNIIGEDTSTEHLEKILFDENIDEEKRIESAKLLGSKKGDKTAIEALKKSVGSKSKRIQIESAISLYKLNEETIALPVLDKYVREGNDEILGRLFIQRKMGSVGGHVVYRTESLYNKAGESILTKALGYENELVRIKAAYYLAKINKKALAYPVAVELLQKSKNRDVKIFAISTLELIRDEKSIFAIKQALSDSDEKVKKRAEWSLEYLKDKKK